MDIAGLRGRRQTPFRSMPALLARRLPTVGAGERQRGHHAAGPQGIQVHRTCGTDWSDTRRRESGGSSPAKRGWGTEAQRPSRTAGAPIPPDLQAERQTRGGW